METIAVVSGGIDSVTLAYMIKEETEGALVILTFNYGQRHYDREALCAFKCAQKLGAEFHNVDIANLRPLLSGSALTDEIPVPNGHYADENMRVTVVPNRNAIFLSVAYGLAVSRQADCVAIGVHAGDHPIYPDCRPQFIQAFQEMERLATEGHRKETLYLYAPFVWLTKADIVRLGHGLGVPYDQTWSCYKGGDVHCGTCGTCVERREAFELAGVPDPTEYASTG